MLRCTSHRMPHNDTVRGHRLQIPGRVEQRFALADAGSRNADVDSVGREPLSGNFKRGTRSGGRLEEEVYDCSAAQGRHLLYFASGDVAKRFGSVEQVSDLAGLKFADSQQMFAIEVHVVLSGQLVVSLVANWLFVSGFQN